MALIYDLEAKIKQICRDLQNIVRTGNINNFRNYYSFYNNYRNLTEVLIPAVGTHNYEYWLNKWHPKAVDILEWRKIIQWINKKLSLYPQYLEPARFISRAYYQMRNSSARKVVKKTPSGGKYTIWEKYIPEQYKKDWAVALKLLANIPDIVKYYKHIFGEGIPTDKSRNTKPVSPTLPARIEPNPPLTASQIATRCKQVLSLRKPQEITKIQEKIQKEKEAETMQKIKERIEEERREYIEKDEYNTLKQKIQAINEKIEELKKQLTEINYQINLFKKKITLLI